MNRSAVKKCRVPCFVSCFEHFASHFSIAFLAIAFVSVLCVTSTFAGCASSDGRPKTGARAASDETTENDDPLKRIVSLRLAGRLDEARESAETLLRAPGTEPHTAIALHLELAKIHDRVGLHTNTRPVEAALTEIRRADSLAANLDPGARGAVAHALAYYYYRAEAAERVYARATEFVEHAIHLLTEAGNVRLLSEAVHLRGLIHMQKRELDEARRLFDESRALDERAGTSEWFLGEYHRHVAFVHMFGGDWESALPHFEQSLQYRRNAGAIDAGLFASSSVGLALVRTGRCAEAAPYLHDAIEVAKRIGSSVGEARAWLALAQMHECFGDDGREDARSAYENARDTAARVDDTGIVERTTAALEALAR